MKAINEKILVRVDMGQKETIKIGGVVLSMANVYETNYRYRAPVMATIVSGNKYLKEGESILCHHNLFYEPSPYQVDEGLFSIPFSKVLFAKIDSEGGIHPICGNIIVQEIEVESFLPLPPEQVTMHKNRYKIVNPGWTEYREGQIIFTRPSTGYTIIYHVDGVQKSVTKVDSSMICGILK